MNKALRYKEPDQVPVSDWLWGSFVMRRRQTFGLPAHGDNLRHRAIGSMRDTCACGHPGCANSTSNASAEGRPATTLHNVSGARSCDRVGGIAVGLE